MTASPGFTLVEIMLASVLIGLLAALAVPAFQRLHAKAQNVHFGNDLRVAAQALEHYAMDKGSWPPDGGGSWPEEVRDYLPPPDRWSKPTPVGGLWQWARDVDGHDAVLQVTGHIGGWSRALALDRQIDDGDLSQGSFRGDETHLVYVMGR